MLCFSEWHATSRGKSHSVSQIINTSMGVWCVAARSLWMHTSLIAARTTCNMFDQWARWERGQIGMWEFPATPAQAAASLEAVSAEPKELKAQIQKQSKQQILQNGTSLSQNDGRVLITRKTNFLTLSETISGQFVPGLEKCKTAYFYVFSLVIQ